MENQSTTLNRLKIAIDGPAGAGKSTLARLLGEKLGIPYIDTGAIYRALALKAHRMGISEDDEENLAKLARELKIEFKRDERGMRVYLDGEDVSEAIRTPQITRLSSPVSKHPKVREALLELQRKLAENGGVMEGRDIGTVILPDADVKIFLTASVKVRAFRRYLELKEKGYEVNLEDLEREIEERDKRDSTRSVAPLRMAEDAVLLNTDNLTIEEMVEKALRIIREKCGIG
ncbi:(d)CMP kinase [bacterium]|nr:(d)CMP kinase [bacterium]